MSACVCLCAFGRHQQNESTLSLLLSGTALQATTCVHLLWGAFGAWLRASPGCPRQSGTSSFSSDANTIVQLFFSRFFTQERCSAYCGQLADSTVKPPLPSSSSSAGALKAPIYLGAVAELQFAFVCLSCSLYFLAQFFSFTKYCCSVCESHYRFSP